MLLPSTIFANCTRPLCSSFASNVFEYSGRDQFWVMVNPSTPRTKQPLIDPGTSHTTSPDPSDYRIFHSSSYNNNQQALDSDSNLQSLRQPLLADEQQQEESPEDPPISDFPQMVNVPPEEESSDGLWRQPPGAEASPDNDENNDEPHSHRHVPWYKNPYQRMAMISNLGTSYNVVNISLVLPILEQILQEQQHSDTTTLNSLNSSSSSFAEDSSAVASSLLAGMIVGQVLGGFLGDTVGLAGALRGVMILQIVASLGSAFTQHNLFFALAAWRFILGVGAGAVYPLAACLSVEGGGRGVDHHNSASDAALARVVRTFAVQGIGFWLVPALALPLLYIPRIPLHVTWRILLAVGCIPGLVLLYLQWQLYARQQQQREAAESTHHHHNNNNNAEDERGDDEEEPRENAAPHLSRTESLLSANHSAGSEASVNDRELLRADSDGEVGTFLDSSPDLSSEGCYGESEPPAIRQGWWASLWMEDQLCQKVLGTAVTWFLFDVLFYGNTLFQPIVVEAAFGPRQDDNNAAGERHVLQRNALDSFLLTSIALPGYAVAGLLIGKKTCGLVQSVRYVMLQGFALMSLSYLLIGLFWDELRHFPILLVIIYGFSFFFANYGPNTTTFILPSLVYSAECRSTLNGLSAAAGKLGALTGATLFAPAADSFGDAAVMLICAMIGFVAFMMTVFFVQIPSSRTTSTTTATTIQQSSSYTQPPEQSDQEPNSSDPLAPDAEDPLRQPPAQNQESLPHERGSFT